MKLARRITVLFVLTFLVITAAFAVRMARREIAIYESQIAIDLHHAGAALRPAFIEVWRVEGEDRALEVLRAADTGVHGMSIRWLPGAHEAESTGSFRFRSGECDRIGLRMPVEEAGLATGALELTRPLEREQELVRNIIVDRALATFAMVVVIAVLAWVVGRVFLGRPIADLAAYAHRIGGGDLSMRAKVSGKNELGELASEMNRMCDRLEETRAKVAAEHEAKIRTLEQLRHADRLSTVGRLAAGLAHELGTPLNVVAGRAKMIAGAASDDPTKNNATIIQAQTRRMTNLIRQLLDFARRGEARKTEVDAHEMLRSAAALLEPIARKKDITLALDLPDAPLHVALDRQKIEQVLTNLIVNALDASPASGTVTIRSGVDESSETSSDGAKRRWRVEVADCGSGITPENLKHVFEPFFTTKDVGEGTGLGLSVALGIVEEHEGSISAESAPGQGSRFTVYLPMDGPAHGEASDRR